MSVAMHQTIKKKVSQLTFCYHSIPFQISFSCLFFRFTFAKRTLQSHDWKVVRCSEKKVLVWFFLFYIWDRKSNSPEHFFFSLSFSFSRKRHRLLFSSNFCRRPMFTILSCFSEIHLVDKEDPRVSFDLNNFWRKNWRKHKKLSILFLLILKLKLTYLL